MTALINSSVSPSTTADLDRLRGPTRDTLDKEKARLRQATQEFESFFVYEMLKTMRETVPEGGLSGEGGMSDGLGKETFTSMFDMEIARRIKLGGHNSIAEMLYKSMEPLIDAEFAERPESPEIRPLNEPVAAPLPVSGDEGIPMTSGSSADDRSFKPIAEPDVSSRPQTQSIAPTGIEITPTAKPPLSRPSDQGVSELPVRQPRPALKQDDILARFGSHIFDAARENRLDSSLIAAVIRTESSGDPNAVSHAGAKGLMQLSDTTAQDLRVNDPFDPGENIRAGSRYLRRMLDRFGDLELALAAYNAGPGNVEKYGGVPPFTETRRYLEKISGLLGRPL